MFSKIKKLFSKKEKTKNELIPTGTTHICDHEFERDSSLIIVTIPDSVTKIGSYAFSNCSSLYDFILYYLRLTRDYP